MRPGAIAAQVTPDSPASRGGLKEGDVIRSVNGQTMVNGSALQVAVSEQMPGSKITLGILRDGQPETLNLTVGEYGKGKTEVADNDDAGQPQKPGKLGLAVADLTTDVRQQLQLPEKVHGVAIESVRPASPAEDAGLASGDVILEVNRKPVAFGDGLCQPGSRGSERQGHAASGLVQRQRQLPPRSPQPERLDLKSKVFKNKDLGLDLQHGYPRYDGFTVAPGVFNTRGFQHPGLPTSGVF